MLKLSLTNSTPIYTKTAHVYTQHERFLYLFERLHMRNSLYIAYRYSTISLYYFLSFFSIDFLHNFLYLVLFILLQSSNVLRIFRYIAKTLFIFQFPYSSCICLVHRFHEYPIQNLKNNNLMFSYDI